MWYEPHKRRSNDMALLKEHSVSEKYRASVVNWTKKHIHVSLLTCIQYYCRMFNRIDPSLIHLFSHPQLRECNLSLTINTIFFGVNNNDNENENGHKIEVVSVNSQMFCVFANQLNGRFSLTGFEIAIFWLMIRINESTVFNFVLLWCLI